PALGLKDNELRIPDDAGVVGQVVHTGQPRRIRLSEGAEIDRQVDRSQNYLTRTLLCVPLHGSDGEILGAFEAINKLTDKFTADDVQARVELAAHAAVALETTQRCEQLLSRHRHGVEQAAENVWLVGGSAAVEALLSSI